MSLSRRRILALGGGLCAALSLPRNPSAATVEVIEMRGTARGDRIWFAPVGLAVAPGTTLRFCRRCAGTAGGAPVAELRSHAEPLEIRMAFCKFR